MDELSSQHRLVIPVEISAVAVELGWQLKIGVEEGVKRLFDWVVENREMF